MAASHTGAKRHSLLRRGRHYSFQFRRRIFIIVLLILFLILISSETIYSFLRVVFSRRENPYEQRVEHHDDPFDIRFDKESDVPIVQRDQKLVEDDTWQKETPLTHRHETQNEEKEKRNHVHMSNASEIPFPAPPGRRRMDFVFAPNSCQLSNEGESVGAMRVQFMLPHCKKGHSDGTKKNTKDKKSNGKNYKHKGGDSDGCELDKSQDPIVAFAPIEPTAFFFPTDVIADNESTRLRRVTGLFESKAADGPDGLQETQWRPCHGANPTLRCLPGEQTERHWVWDSGGLTVRITLSSRRGPLEGRFAFDVKTAVAFFGLPARGSGVRLPSDLTYTAVNEARLANEVLSPGKALSGTVPLVYAIGRTKHDGVRKAIGILWLNTSPLKIRTTSVEYDSISVRFASKTGSTRLFLLPGPTPADVLLQYYSITGFPWMPPRFALGYHHAHHNYSTEATIKEVSDGFSRVGIPVDTLGLGMGHAIGGRIFTWDAKQFPNPNNLQRQIWEEDGGRMLVLTTVPYVPVDQLFTIYKEGRQREFFVTQSPESDDLYVSPIPIKGHVWIDFLNPRARRWFAGMFKYKRFVGSTNHTFFSLEGNEPSIPGEEIDTFSPNAGHAGSIPHDQVHNAYSMFHAMAVYAGQVRRTLESRRPFLITRSFFSGTQRYAAVRVGPSDATWSDLQASLEASLSYSIAGLPFVGPDVGGFHGEPDEELLVRWYQLGAFQPLFRADGAELFPTREPWRYAAHTLARIRDAVCLRYALLPYLYTLFWRAHVYGEAILRPVFFMYPQDPIAHVDPAMLSRRFFLGPALLVAPVLTSIRDGPSESVELPNEAMYDYWTGKLYPPRSILHVARVLSTSGRVEPVAPVFQRVGTVVPWLSNTRGMRSSHAAANFTLAIALPPLSKGTPLDLRDDGDSILARGDMFLDDGSSYADFHRSGGKPWTHCVLSLACVWRRSAARLVIRGEGADPSSSCDAVHHTLTSAVMHGEGKYAFVLTHLRLMFATVGDGKRAATAHIGDDGEPLHSLWKTDTLLELSGMALSIVSQNTWEVTLRFQN